MKINIILFFLTFFAGCGIFRSDSAEQWVSDNQDTDNSAGKIEERLVVAVEQFIQQHKLNILIEETGKIRSTLSHPVIAVTDEELIRLVTAWNSEGPAHEILARRFTETDKAINEGLNFPPEGGQHNQWYQCDSCQRSLRTVDPHHHQCPVCNRIYSGFPYDNVLYSRQHSRNLRLAEDAACAWAVTGDRKYADFAAEVLSGYADRYLNYPMLHASVNDKTVDVAAGKKDKYRTAGHINEQTLGEAMLMIPAANAYDLIYNSNALTDEKKYHIEKHFLHAMAECINGYKAGKSNWQTWHNAALLYAGAVIGDGDMIRQALLNKENGFITQMKISVMPEGMWYENSWGYHYYTLTAMTHLAEGGRRMGFDLYSHPLLRKMYLVAFDYLMADGSLPRFGDAVQDSPNRPGINQKAFAVYKDERLIAHLPTDLTWDKIVLGYEQPGKITMMKPLSKLIPGSGHAVLATDGPGKLTAALTFGPYGGFHGHFDKLSFVFFGYGQELVVDPGRAASQAYRLPIHQDWYKASTGHNLVLVDGRSQKEAEGKCLAFNATGSYAGITADAGPAFDNVSHKRFLLLSPVYLLVIDELRSTDGSEHTFDWIYHNKGHEISCMLDENKIELGSVPRGYTYLHDIKSYSNDKKEPISIKIFGDKTDLWLRMQCQVGDEVFTAKGPFTSIEDRVPMLIVRRKGELVRFLTVLEPVLSGQEPIINKLIITPRSELALNIIYTGGEDHISFMGSRLEDFIIEKKKGSDRKLILKP